MNCHDKTLIYLSTIFVDSFDDTLTQMTNMNKYHTYSAISALNNEHYIFGGSPNDDESGAVFANGFVERFRYT